VDNLKITIVLFVKCGMEKEVEILSAMSIDAFMSLVLLDLLRRCLNDNTTRTNRQMHTGNN
jgi:hypothetical protein